MTAPQQVAAWFWQAWLAAIVFVFPIPGTIALRNLLLLAGLIALGKSLAQRAIRPGAVPILTPAAWALAATTTWLFFQSLALAPAPAAALDNLRGDWLMPLLTATLAAFASARTGSRGAVQAVVAALLAHILWVFGWQFSRWVAAGMQDTWPVVIVPFGQNDYQSSINGFLLAMLLAERMARHGSSPSRPTFTNISGWAALAASLIADVALRLRNGTLVSIAMVTVAALWMGRRQRRFLVLLLATGTLVSTSIGLDPRWSGLRESLAMGWNSPTLYWMDMNPEHRPRTPSGAAIEESAYMRAAWAHQAVLAIVEHPLGLGFGRDGFGRAIEAKFGYKGMVSSHNGWLDFALGAGLPGLALLLLTAALAMRGGWRQFRQHDDAAGLMFCFLVGGYLLRCLLDGHLSGWRLGLFAFICGVLIAAMKPPPRRT